MTATDVLEEFKAIGVEVIPQGGNLVICPASKVPPELKERLRSHKAEILASLKRSTEVPGPVRIVEWEA